jgi:hypothetical protein
MKKNSHFLGALLILVILTASCKKCCTCTATDTSGHQIATQDYCSTSGTNLTTFEDSFKTTYGTYSVKCTRQH